MISKLKWWYIPVLLLSAAKPNAETWSKPLAGDQKSDDDWVPVAGKCTSCKPSAKDLDSQATNEEIRKLLSPPLPKNHNAISGHSNNGFQYQKQPRLLNHGPNYPQYNQAPTDQKQHQYYPQAPPNLYSPDIGQPFYNFDVNPFAYQNPGLKSPNDKYFADPYKATLASPQQLYVAPGYPFAGAAYPFIQPPRIPQPALPPNPQFNNIPATSPKTTVTPSKIRFPDNKKPSNVELQLLYVPVEVLQRDKTSKSKAQPSSSIYQNPVKTPIIQSAPPTIQNQQNFRPGDGVKSQNPAPFSQFPLPDKNTGQYFANNQHALQHPVDSLPKFIQPPTPQASFAQPQFNHYTNQPPQGFSLRGNGNGANNPLQNSPNFNNHQNIGPTSPPSLFSSPSTYVLTKNMLETRPQQFPDAHTESYPNHQTAASAEINSLSYDFGHQGVNFVTPNNLEYATSSPAPAMQSLFSSYTSPQQKLKTVPVQNAHQLYTFSTAAEMLSPQASTTPVPPRSYGQQQFNEQPTNYPPPHQPPLSVYLERTKDSKINDILKLLKNSKTIPVLDAFEGEMPPVFVGPSELDSPRGYAKFDLPYLSSLDTNRIEKTIDKLPFFVAPLNFKPPPGYSKIPFPAPHIGSVVVSNSSRQSLHNKDFRDKYTTKKNNEIQSTPITVDYFAAQEITTTPLYSSSSETPVQTYYSAIQSLNTETTPVTKSRQAGTGQRRPIHRGFTTTAEPATTNTKLQFETYSTEYVPQPSVTTNEITEQYYNQPPSKEHYVNPSHYSQTSSSTENIIQNYYREPNPQIGTYEQNPQIGNDEQNPQIRTHENNPQIGTYQQEQQYNLNPILYNQNLTPVQSEKLSKVPEKTNNETMYDEFVKPVKNHVSSNTADEQYSISPIFFNNGTYQQREQYSTQTQGTEENNYQPSGTNFQHIQPLSQFNPSVLQTDGSSTAVSSPQNINNIPSAENSYSQSWYQDGSPSWNQEEHTYLQNQNQQGSPSWNLNNQENPPEKLAQPKPGYSAVFEETSTPLATTTEISYSSEDYTTPSTTTFGTTTAQPQTSYKSKGRQRNRYTHKQISTTPAYTENESPNINVEYEPQKNSSRSWYNRFVPSRHRATENLGVSSSEESASEVPKTSIETSSPQTEVKPAITRRRKPNKPTTTSTEVSTETNLGANRGYYRPRGTRPPSNAEPGSRFRIRNRTTSTTVASDDTSADFENPVPPSAIGSNEISSPPAESQQFNKHYSNNRYDSMEHWNDRVAARQRSRFTPPTTESTSTESPESSSEGVMNQSNENSSEVSNSGPQDNSKEQTREQSSFEYVAPTAALDYTEEYGKEGAESKTKETSQSDFEHATQKYLVEKDENGKNYRVDSARKVSPSKRRGVWVKRVRVKKPQDVFETAESQSVAQVSENSITTSVTKSTSAKEPEVEPTKQTETTLDVRNETTNQEFEGFNQDFTYMLTELLSNKNDSEKTTTTVENETEPNFISNSVDYGKEVTNSGIKKVVDNKRVEHEEETTKSPSVDDASNATHQSLIEAMTTTESKELMNTVFPEKGESTVIPESSNEIDTPTTTQLVGTSTTTEISLETEICYKGRCFKSKKTKASDLLPTE